jgi:poly-gamma-glutamate capsule biosynthesis protein CapA/YwtB (metallophosphatase superfamily)
MQEIIKLRNRILVYENFDFFEHSTTISPAWIRQANQEYQRVICQDVDANTKRDTDET